MAKQVVDFRASKGMSVAQSDEHQRNWTEKGWKWAQAHGNYDRTRAKLNFEIAKGGKVQPIDTSKSIPQRMAESLAARGIKDPNEGLKEPRYRTVVNFIFGGSRDRMHELAFGNQKVDLSQGADNSHIRRMPEIELWAKDIYDHVCEQWGEDNIVGFYVHNDETNPHIHCTLLPIDSRKKFAFKRMFAGEDIYEFKRRTAALHDSFAKVNGKWGLSRGDSIELTKAKNCNPEQYRKELSYDCSRLEAEIEGNKSVLQQLYMDIAKAERRVKGLTTMIENLEKSRCNLLDDIDDLQKKLDAGQGDSDELERQIKAKRKELVDIDDKLADKRGKLDEADQILLDRKAEVSSMQDCLDALNSKYSEASQGMFQQFHYKLSDVLLENVINDFYRLLPSMSMSDRSLFDDTLLMDMAERGNNIMNCAMMLFGGYVDKATALSEKCGGGGTSCTQGWGRDPNEDERLWAMRCLRQASRMMKPKSPRGIRRR